MEIERKYKIECLNDLPENYRAFPCHAIEQAVAFRAKCKMFSRHLQKPILKTEKGRFKGL